MVVGRDFAWGHVGKTGGDATAMLFRCVPDLFEFAHATDNPKKHLPFRKMGAESKRLVLNIRRLPSVTLSFVHHARVHGLGEFAKPGTEWTPEDAIALGRPERELVNMLRPDLRVHRWLRMEQLRDDFFAFVSTLRPISDEERAAIFSVPTKRPAQYDHAIDHFFSPDHLVELYRSSPRWAAAELEAYGDLPIAVGSLDPLPATEPTP